MIARKVVAHAGIQQTERLQREFVVQVPVGLNVVPPGVVEIDAQSATIPKRRLQRASQAIGSLRRIRYIAVEADHGDGGAQTIKASIEERARGTEPESVGHVTCQLNLKSGHARLAGIELYPDEASTRTQDGSIELLANEFCGEHRRVDNEIAVLRVPFRAEFEALGIFRIKRKDAQILTHGVDIEVDAPPLKPSEYEPYNIRLSLA